MKSKLRRVVLADGCTFMGHYLNGVRHGFGIKTYPNGAQYAGQYSNGVRHGYGKKTHADGITEVTVFYQNGIKQ